MNAKAQTTKITPKESTNDAKEFQQLRDESSIPETEMIGELAVDVFQTPEHIVVVTPIAGVRARDISIEITKNGDRDDVLTIKGSRSFTFNVEERNYVTQECFWGSFSRSIILPDYVNAQSITATFKDGTLTVKIPKVEPVATRLVKVKEE